MQRGLIITDGPFSGTGFSEEMRNILFRIQQASADKYEFFWFSLQHTGFPFEIIDEMFPDIPHKGSKMTVLGHRPRNTEVFGAEHFPIHWATVKPDWVLFMGDPRNVRSYVMGNLGDSNTVVGSLKQKLAFPLYMYVTLDGLPIHPEWLEYLSQVNVLIAMTEWAQIEYVKTGLSPAFIHHGINWKWWSTNPDEKALIKRKYGIPQDCTVFINWDVPQHRKRTDALLRAWKNFKPETKNTKLILYSDWRMENTLGWNIDGLIKQYNVPRETVISPLQLQKRPKEWACPERPEQLLEIAKLGDVYLSTTSGEGFGKCLHPDSPIITFDGIKKISEVKIGDVVLDENGKWTRVLATKSKDHSGQLIKIESYGNIPIYVTPEHLIKAFKRPKRKHKKGFMWEGQNPEWIKAEDLKKGDVVLFPIFSDINNTDETQIESFDLLTLDSTLETNGEKVWYRMGYSNNGELIKVNRFITLDRELVKLLGIYVAEGSKNEISIGKELKIIDELKQIYIDKFGVVPKIYERETTFRFCITEKIISIFLTRLCGEGAENKTIPKSILEHKDSSILMDFLQYYWLGDGEKGKFLSGFTTVSDKLVTTLKLALSSLQRIVMIEKDIGNNCYRVDSRSSTQIHSNKAWYNKNGFIGYLIKDIARENYSGKVVDIQTNGSFSTLSFTVHNCGLEAQGLGMPIVITDYSACSEVHRKGSILIPITGTFRMDDRRRSVEGGLVDEKKFTEAIEDLYYNKQKRIELGEEARVWSRNFDYDTMIVPRWINLLNSINPDELMVRELLRL